MDKGIINPIPFNQEKVNTLVTNSMYIPIKIK